LNVSIVYSFSCIILQAVQAINSSHNEAKADLDVKVMKKNEDFRMEKF